MNERPRVSDVRKPPPLYVKLAAALMHGGGFTPEEIATPGAIVWDHDPPLKDRKWDAEVGDFIPRQHDPRFLFPKRKADHDVKTFGPGAAQRVHKRGSDISEPIRLDRIATKHQDFQARLLKPDKGRSERQKPGHKAKRIWPKRQFPKREDRT